MRGTQNVIDARRAADVRRPVHVGTEAALMAGQLLVNVDESALRPDSAWLHSSSKAKAEQLVRAANGEASRRVVRPRFVSAGRHDAAARAHRDGPLRPLPLGWRRRQLTATTHIDNTVEGLWLGPRARPAASTS